MVWLRRLPRFVVILSAVALPACALGAIALDLAHQPAVASDAAGSSAWPLANDRPLFGAAGALASPGQPGSGESDGTELHQRVVLPVNDSTSSTSSTEPPPSTELPPTTGTTSAPPTSVGVLGQTTAPPSPPASPVPGPTHYTG